MTEKEPEKMAKWDRMGSKVMIVGGVRVTPTEWIDPNEPMVDELEKKIKQINTAAESFAQRRVDEALERSAVKIGADAESRKCLAYGHDDRYCSYCEAYDDAIDTAQQGIRAMKSQGATNG